MHGAKIRTQMDSVLTRKDSAPARAKIGQNFVAVRCRSWVSLWEEFGRHGKAESDQGPAAEAFSAVFKAVLMRSADVGFAPNSDRPADIARGRLRAK